MKRRTKWIGSYTFMDMMENKIESGEFENKLEMRNEFYQLNKFAKQKENKFYINILMSESNYEKVNK